MGYLDSRRALLVEMASLFKKKLTPTDISATILIAYLLSSLVLAPNAKYRECRDYILSSRCLHNDVLFLPGSFSFVDGNLLFASGFPENILKAYIPRAFDTAVTNVISYSVSRTIKNARVKTLVEKFSFPRSSSSLGLGSPYSGVNFFTTVKYSLTPFYFGKANEIFLKYGLTAEACGRFFELFFQEYVVLMKKHVKPEFKNDLLGMECFAYINPVDAFISVKRAKYMKQRNLEYRLRHALPIVSISDYGNSKAIKEKVKQSATWGSFGSRAAYLQLYMNNGIEFKKLRIFRQFFDFLVIKCIRYLPMTEANRVAHSYEGVITLNTTLFNPTTELPPNISRKSLEELYNSMKEAA